MLVYGDHREQVESKDRAREINRRIDRIEQMPPGLERHTQLVAALVESGQLLQGIGDALFAERRLDGRATATDHVGRFLLSLGQAVCRSWDSGFREIPPLPRLRGTADWPATVELRLPEGFAFYGVYPEAYVEAARRLKLLAAPLVIGIRSIGTSLGAVVAAALGAPPAVSVRPFGDPFARKIAIDPALERKLLEREAHYVIVDEGPGQSGSSFRSVAEWLTDRGVPEQRIAVLPSHAGQPGPAVSEATRLWWDRVQRQVGDFGDGWPHLVERWCSDLLGRLDEPARDLSGGAWRQMHYARDEHWPPAVPAWERRKFLVSAAGERFLVKFAGLGRIGEEKLAIARSLHREGLVPEPIGLAHGFLVERWCDNAAPLRRGDKPLAEIAHYVGTRARHLPVTSGSGATIDELVTMMRRNISLEFGDPLARAVDPWAARARELEGRIVHVRTDNKLDRHEWLRSSSGALIKTDALDHHQAHDLIGCQDIAWDVAGAMVEFDLNQGEAEGFISAVQDCGQCNVDPELLDFYHVAYLAFRLGQTRLGQAMESAAREQQRLAAQADGYADRVQHLLESTERATRLESLVD